MRRDARCEAGQGSREAHLERGSMTLNRGWSSMGDGILVAGGGSAPSSVRGWARSRLGAARSRPHFPRRVALSQCLTFQVVDDGASFSSMLMLAMAFSARATLPSIDSATSDDVGGRRRGGTAPVLMSTLTGRRAQPERMRARPRRYAGVDPIPGPLPFAYDN